MQRRGRAAGGAIALHADYAVGNGERGCHGIVNMPKQHPEFGRFGVLLVKRGLLVSGDATVEIFDGTGECGQQVCLYLGQVDDEVGFHDGAGKVKSAAVPGDFLRSRLFQAQELNPFVTTQIGETGLFPDSLQLGGTGGAVGHDNLHAGRFQQVDQGADQFRMRGDGLPGVMIAQQVGLQQHPLST